MGALRAAENLARSTPDSELHLVHAFGWPTVSFGSREVVAMSQPGFSEDLDRAREELDKLVGPAARGISRVTSHLRVGAPARAIVQLASDVSADLVVVGTHGRSGFDRLMFGSVAEKVVRSAPCPVLTVRPKTVPIWNRSSRPAPSVWKCSASPRGPSSGASNIRGATRGRTPTTRLPRASRWARRRFASDD